ESEVHFLRDAGGSKARGNAGAGNRGPDAGVQPDRGRHPGRAGNGPGLRGSDGGEPEEPSRRPRLPVRPYVELEEVAFSYGEVRVLDGINLTVEPGDFLGIIGPNGSGKTTLLRIMLG